KSQFVCDRSHASQLPFPTTGLFKVDHAGRAPAPIEGYALCGQIRACKGVSLNRVHARSSVMRAAFLSLSFAMLVSTTVGCLTPAYSGDPNRRTQELIFTSENLRLLLDDWERIWFLDQPSHMTPYRTHGGII